MYSKNLRNSEALAENLGYLRVSAQGTQGCPGGETGCSLARAPTTGAAGSPANQSHALVFTSSDALIMQLCAALSCFSMKILNEDFNEDFIN